MIVQRYLFDPRGHFALVIREGPISKTMNDFAFYPAAHESAIATGPRGADCRAPFSSSEPEDTAA